MAALRIPAVDVPTEYVVWHSPAENLWVGSTPTSYVGMVDLSHDGYVGTDFAGAEVGVFQSLAAARVAVYEAWMEPDPAPFTDKALAAGTDKALATGTDKALAAGTENTLAAGTDKALTTGTVKRARRGVLPRARRRPPVQR